MTFPSSKKRIPHNTTQGVDDPQQYCTRLFWGAQIFSTNWCGKIRAGETSGEIPLFRRRFGPLPPLPIQRGGFDGTGGWLRFPKTRGRPFAVPRASQCLVGTHCFTKYASNAAPVTAAPLPASIHYENRRMSRAKSSAASRCFARAARAFCIIIDAALRQGVNNGGERGIRKHFQCVAI